MSLTEARERTREADACYESKKAALEELRTQHDEAKAALEAAYAAYDPADTRRQALAGVESATARAKALAHKVALADVAVREARLELGGCIAAERAAELDEVNARAGRIGFETAHADDLAELSRLLGAASRLQRKLAADLPRWFDGPDYRRACDLAEQIGAERPQRADVAYARSVLQIPGLYFASGDGDTPPEREQRKRLFDIVYTATRDHFGSTPGERAAFDAKPPQDRADWMRGMHRDDGMSREQRQRARLLTDHEWSLVMPEIAAWERREVERLRQEADDAARGRNKAPQGIGAEALDA